MNQGQNSRRKKSPKVRAGGVVTIVDFPDFDAAMKHFLKMTSGVITEAKQRQYHVKKPTHSARKLRGKFYERKNRLEQEALDKENNRDK